MIIRLQDRYRTNIIALLALLRYGSFVTLTYIAQNLWRDADTTFFWNYKAMKFFISRNLDKYIVPVICGFAGFEKHVNEQTKEQMGLGIISRLSCMRSMHMLLKCTHIHSWYSLQFERNE